MLSFQPLDLKSLQKVKELLQYQTFRTCDYTVLSIFMWQEYFDFEYDLVDGMLFVKNTLPDGRVAFSIPVGSGNVKEAIQKIVEYASFHNYPLYFAFVPKESLSLLEELFPNQLEVSTEPEDSDYLYRLSDLVTLEGNDYKNHRNRINKFVRFYGDVTYEEIDEGNLPLVKQFFQEYLKFHRNKGMLYDYENRKTQEVLENYLSFDIKGGYLTVDGDMIGFIVAELLNDVCYMHIEKALTTYIGAYQILSNEFLKRIDDPAIQYVNLEEDVGDEGLRKAKESYHPIAMLEKSTVYIRPIN